MIMRMVNGKMSSCYTAEELAEQSEVKTMSNNNSNEILLESLRVNLEKVQKERLGLEAKELEIKNQIDTLVQGE